MPPLRAIDRLLLGSLTKGDAAAVEKALSAGAEPNLKVKGVPVLIPASAMGEEKVVKALLAAGADADAKDSNGWSALLYVGWLGSTDQHESIFDQLIEHGADVNGRVPTGGTILDRAAHLLNARMVRKLVAANATGNKDSLLLARDLMEEGRSGGQSI